MKPWKSAALALWTALVFLFPFTEASSGSETNLEGQVQQLREQNDALQTQLRQQQQLIQNLSREVAVIRQANDKRDASFDSMKSASENNTESKPAGFGLGSVQITGEGGIGIFETGSEGAFPNAEFRVDEAKIFVDAPVWGNAYAFVELNLATRESSDLDLKLGEFYLDIEDVSQLWGQDRQLNLRIGRMDIPFGEEYQTRDAIDNPLISHSLVDFWGVDEGIEFYGALGRFSYAAAVQNGGISGTHDFTADKSVAGRVSYDPNRWLHLSVSGMRTGDLSSEKDGVSEIWFANGWFRSLGSAATTMFHANLAQADLQIRLPRGQLKAFGGYVHYADNDPSAQNRRDIYYYSVEGIFDVTRKFYTSARFGQIFAAKGFPIVGNGAVGDYFYGALTDEMWRLSLGIGYRWNRHLVVKAEYSLERGSEVGGGKRDHEDLIATEAAFAF